MSATLLFITILVAEMVDAVKGWLTQSTRRVLHAKYDLFAAESECVGRMENSLIEKSTLLQ